MTTGRSRPVRVTAVLAPTAVTAILGAALVCPAMPLTPSSSELGRVDLVSGCTTRSSGLAKDVTVTVEHAKTISAKRLSIRKNTAKVRVRLAITATGKATGYGSVDACPGGISHPQTVTESVTWQGTTSSTATYTASGRTTKKATRRATREATRLARAAALRVVSDNTVRTTEATVRDHAWAASANPALPTG